MDLETLRTQCLSCQRCPLYATRTNVVFGQGVPTAEVLFVGEGPGQSEDEQGLPFVGRSGQLLDKYLFAIDLDRSKELLHRQHRQVPPAPEPRPAARRERGLYALAAGAVPAAAAQDRGLPGPHRRPADDPARFFGDEGARAPLWKRAASWFMGTFHPAALLRHPQNKPAAFGDFAALRDKIGEVCDHTY